MSLSYELLIKKWSISINSVIIRYNVPLAMTIQLPALKSVSVKYLTSKAHLFIFWHFVITHEYLMKMTSISQLTSYTGIIRHWLIPVCNIKLIEAVLHTIFNTDVHCFGYFPYISYINHGYLGPMWYTWNFSFISS